MIKHDQQNSDKVHPLPKVLKKRLKWKNSLQASQLLLMHHFKETIGKVDFGAHSHVLSQLGLRFACFTQPFRRILSNTFFFHHNSFGGKNGILLFFFNTISSMSRHQKLPKQKIVIKLQKQYYLVFPQHPSSCLKILIARLKTDWNY